jgi:hypothetical protein
MLKCYLMRGPGWRVTEVEPIFVRRGEPLIFAATEAFTGGNGVLIADVYHPLIRGIDNAPAGQRIEISWGTWR